MGLGWWGYLVLTRPWPAICRTIWGVQDRYVRPTSRVRPEMYVAATAPGETRTGTSGSSGRIDDVMNVAGHRLSTFEVESALVDNAKVAEAAVVSRPDDLVGEAIVAFVTLRSAYVGTRRWRESCARTSPRDREDRAAAWDHLHADLPKTHSARSCGDCCATWHMDGRSGRHDARQRGDRRADSGYVGPRRRRREELRRLRQGQLVRCRVKKSTVMRAWAICSSTSSAWWPPP